MLLLLLPVVSALTFYIDEEIALQPTGDALIKGTTNIDFLTDLHPLDGKISGATSELTAKKGKYWLFTFAPQQNVTATLIKVSLPKGSVVNYIKSSLPVSISTSNDVITLSFSGEGKVDIAVQYSVEPLQGNSVFWAWLFGMLSLVLGASLVLKNKKKQSKLSLIRPTLNETQLKIIDALQEKGGEASQTTIQYMTSVPKASLSRNVEILAQKEILQKFFNGTTNHIKIHPKMK